MKKKDELFELIKKYHNIDTLLKKLIKKSINLYPYVIEYIIKNYQLNETTIENYKNYLNFKQICKYQNLSFEFIIKNIKYIDFEELLKNKNFQKLDLTEIQKIILLKHIPENLKKQYIILFNITKIRKFFDNLKKFLNKIPRYLKNILIITLFFLLFILTGTNLFIFLIMLYLLYMYFFQPYI